MAKPVFSSLQQNTLRVSALNAIRDSILSGALKPGQQLIQADIASQMNISRAPVREALRQLEEEGLVESAPYRGTFVSRVTRRDISELYSLRGTLESFAVRLAIERSTDEQLLGLQAIVDRMAAAADADDHRALDLADLAFHERIFALSQHRRLLKTWESHAKLIQRIQSLRNQLSPLHDIVATHRPLMATILARDVEAAQRAAEVHCIRSAERLTASWPGQYDDACPYPPGSQSAI